MSGMKKQHEKDNEKETAHNPPSEAKMEVCEEIQPD